MLGELAEDLVDEHYRVPNLVGVENVGRQGVAAPMPDAALRVEEDAAHGEATGKTSGSACTERSALVYLSSTPGGIS